MPKELELITQTNASELGVKEQEELLSQYAGAYSEAKAIIAEADITVTDESQLDLMFAARDARLKLKAIRVTVEKTRKTLKEDSLRKGKVIDGMANIIKGIIEPAEAHLEAQEKYAELKEAARKDTALVARQAALAPYVEEMPAGLRDMDDKAFEIMLKGYKSAHEEELAATAKAELEQAMADQAEATKRAELEAENAKLKAAVDEAERKTKEAEAKTAAEAKAKADAELAATEATRQASLAPDKEKVSNYLTALLAVELPAVTDPKAQELLKYISSNLNQMNTATTAALTRI